MLKKILLALIFVITAITNVTHAEDDMKTVASKAYVDTKIETKQLKIPAAGQPNVGAGETVMTYTATGNGQIGERGLYSDISSYDATTDGDKLITASALNATFTNLPTTDTTKLECANQADGCTLWTIVDQTAYGNGLPSGYTRLEYIQNAASTYVNTSIIPQADDIEMNIRYYCGSLGSNYIFQSRASTSGHIFGLAGGQSGATIAAGWDSAATSSTISREIGHIYNLNLRLNNGTMTLRVIDETTGQENTVSTDYTWAEPASPFGIFGNAGGNRIGAGQRVFSVWMKVNGQYVMNYIPATYNDAVGFYDSVSQTFKEATVGSFVAGPAVN